MSCLLGDGWTWLKYCCFGCSTPVVVVSYCWGRPRLVLVNHLEGLSLPRNSATINWPARHDLVVDWAVKLQHKQQTRVMQLCNSYNKMLYYCRTCFSMGDLGMQVSVRTSVRQHLPWVSCERNSSYSFVPIFLKLCRCFHHGMRMWCGLDIIVRLFFITFSTLWTFRPQCIDSGYLVSATPHKILYRSFWNFAHVFSMVWRCVCG